MAVEATPFTVAILAGGKSIRMGGDKAFVEFMGKPMIAHVLAALTGLGQSETILIANQPESYADLGLPTYTDVLPDKGSLGGIYTALSHSQSPYTLVVGCDMPFVSPALLRYMVGLIDHRFDAIVPRSEGRPEGLHAIYSRACMTAIREYLEADRLKVSGFYDQVRMHYIDEAEYRQYDPQGRSFMNVNTPEELTEARRLAESSQG